MQDEIRRLKLDLEEERSAQNLRYEKAPFSVEDADWETQKLIDDYKFKLQKAEQDVSTLQTNVSAECVNVCCCCNNNRATYSCFFGNI